MDEPEVFEVYGWNFDAQDYFLVYRGTDENEAKRAQRAVVREAKKVMREKRKIEGETG